MIELKVRTLLAVCAVSLLVSGCARPKMKTEFRSYNAAYAESLNEQMLLNLARLENGHPAYYLAIGAINNKFSITSGLTAGSSPQFTDNTTVTETSGPGGVGLATRAIQRLSGSVFGGSVQGRYDRVATPDFQFIPLNNEAVARQVLEPMSADIFTTLYLQGYPIDQLMRVMIERIETTLPSGEEVVLVNSAALERAPQFARFLRTCGILRELQIRGDLMMDTRGETAGTNAPATPMFFLDSKHSAKTLGQFSGSSDYRLAVTNVVRLLENGITIKTRVGNRGQANTRLVLRSFDRAMSAVASEQVPFQLLKEKGLLAEVPEMELRPILRTMWDEKANLAPNLETVKYAGKTYRITDPVLDPLDPSAKWNRDVFRLMIVLASQVTVDISKFQRQVLELR